MIDIYKIVDGQDEYGFAVPSNTDRVIVSYIAYGILFEQGHTINVSAKPEIKGPFHPANVPPCEWSYYSFSSQD